MQHAHLRYIAFSYSDGITTRDNNKMARLVTSPAYQQLWGDRFQMIKTGEFYASGPFAALEDRPAN
jgi:hypothetical protein